MSTLGIDLQEMLVLPKVIALLIALPLLTVFADLLGVFGGMWMARAQLGVGHGEFVDRFAKAISATTLPVGIGKAPVPGFSHPWRCRQRGSANHPQRRAGDFSGDRRRRALLGRFQRAGPAA